MLIQFDLITSIHNKIQYYMLEMQQYGSMMQQYGSMMQHYGSMMQQYWSISYCIILLALNVLQYIAILQYLTSCL